MNLSCYRFSDLILSKQQLCSISAIFSMFSLAAIPGITSLLRTTLISCKCNANLIKGPQLGTFCP